MNRLFIRLIAIVGLLADSALAVIPCGLWQGIHHNANTILFGSQALADSVVSIPEHKAPFGFKTLLPTPSPAAPPADEGPAIRYDGSALTSHDKAKIDYRIEEAFRLGQARRIGGKDLDAIDPEGLSIKRNTEVWRIPLLARRRSRTVLAHPGRGGVAWDHKARRVYFSDDGYVDLNHRSLEAKREFWNHEADGHLDHPEWSEVEVQKHYPLTQLLAEFRAEDERELERVWGNLKPHEDSLEAFEYIYWLARIGGIGYVTIHDETGNLGPAPTLDQLREYLIGNPNAVIVLESQSSFRYPLPNMEELQEDDAKEHVNLIIKGIQGVHTVHVLKQPEGWKNDADFRMKMHETNEFVQIVTKLKDLGISLPKIAGHRSTSEVTWGMLNFTLESYLESAISHIENTLNLDRARGGNLSALEMFEHVRTFLDELDRLIRSGKTAMNEEEVEDIQGRIQIKQSHITRIIEELLAAPVALARKITRQYDWMTPDVMQKINEFLHWQPAIDLGSDRPDLGYYEISGLPGMALSQAKIPNWPYNPGYSLTIHSTTRGTRGGYVTLTNVLTGQKKTSQLLPSGDSYTAKIYELSPDDLYTVSVSIEDPNVGEHPPGSPEHSPKHSPPLEAAA